MTSATERFWAKVQRGSATECWLWTAGKHSAGYGAFWYDEKHGYAHRFSFELHVGPIPDGLVLDHLCRVRQCVNPGHLEPVPMGVNTARGLAPSAINARKASCPQGHPYDLVIGRKRYCSECRRQGNVQYRTRRGAVRLTPEQRARKTELQRRRRAAASSPLQKQPEPTAEGAFEGGGE